MLAFVQAFAALPTTCISDALNGLTNMNSSIRPLLEKHRVCGPAHTVSILANDNLAVLRGIRTAKAGDVLVVDAKGYDYNCIAGDFVIGMAKTLGLAGLVVDGTIRDIAGVKALDFPVFCKGTTIAAGGKAGAGTVNLPVSCGGITVNPGDIIVGDADGVAVVPCEQAEAVAVLAQEKDRKDKERCQRVLGDAEAVRRYLDSVLGS